MADDNEPTLRNALNAVRVGRTLALLGITALFFAIAIALAAMLSGGVSVNVPASGATAVAERTAPPKMLYVIAASEMLLIACATAAIMLQVARMTRIILRAIDASRR